MSKDWRRHEAKTMLMGTNPPATHRGPPTGVMRTKILSFLTASLAVLVIVSTVLVMGSSTAEGLSVDVGTQILPTRSIAEDIAASIYTNPNRMST